MIVDMATSQVARGHILKAARVREPIPEGWAVDAEGQPTTDPEAAMGGRLLPLGGEKGFALALLVEVLSGVLADAAVGRGWRRTCAAWAAGRPATAATRSGRGA